jgi:superfamily II DNA or RNA helicase
VSVRELWAIHNLEGGNTARQLVMPRADATVRDADDETATLDCGDDTVLVHRAVRAGERDEPVLTPGLDARGLLSCDPNHLSWARTPSPAHPDDVLRRLAGRFRLVEETAESPGFRAPQAGAIHSVLGYWTTEARRDAIVVMPTGTGKTDTMVALFAGACPRRLLVLVPSDALRTQVADTFEELGVLPDIGAVEEGPPCFPVVGRLRAGLKTDSEARSFARRCNVVVATPQALNASTPSARGVFAKEFDVLFVDEAHHVAARTWATVRSEFEDKKVVQFTATPYREDRQDLGGKIVYSFPLGLAQRHDYFSPINYRAVRALGDEDKHIARTALDQLRSDLDAGHDHVVMARVNRKARADEVVEIYRELGPEFSPIVLYSGHMPARDRSAAINSLRYRSTRVVVCVDMLGEGFDLPALKIAAIHDPHKSLGITLQFVGRFARVHADVGDATIVVGRPDALHDENLRSLYGEDPDWNLLIRDLSERATQAEEDATEFDEGFMNVPTGLAAHAINPKMSTVVFRTSCDEWDPQAALDFVGSDRALTNPIPHNPRASVAWLVTRSETTTSWGPDLGYTDIEHEMYAMYWNRHLGLLYINSSNNESGDTHHEHLAAALTGGRAELIRGEDVFRIYGGVQRLVATNLGVLDIRNRARRFAMFSGPDVTAGFPTAEQETKTQTNIFANGHDNGDRVHLGASLKGRVWSWQPAGTLWHWIQWCDDVGRKLINTSIDIDEVFSNFIRPEVLTERPSLVVLGVEWPADVYSSLTGDLRVSSAGHECPAIDAELAVREHNTAGPIQIAVRTPEWTVPYELDITADGISAQPASDAKVRVISTSRDIDFADYVTQRGITLLLEHDAVIEAPGVLYRPSREVPGFPRRGLRTHIPWDGIDITVEAQGPTKKPNSIQRRVIDTMLARGVGWASPDGAAETWELIIDDDGSNELADVVGVSRHGDTLHVQLVHCKYSTETTPGGRVGDLYEVCGQAQKSVARRRDLTLLVPHLIRRERNRRRRGRSGFEAGDANLLYEIESQLHTVKLELGIVIVQPGVSAAAASAVQLDLLASTEMYVLEVGGASLAVVVSE